MLECVDASHQETDDMNFTDHLGVIMISREITSALFACSFTNYLHMLHQLKYKLSGHILLWPNSSSCNIYYAICHF